MYYINTLCIPPSVNQHKIGEIRHIVLFTEFTSYQFSTKSPTANFVHYHSFALPTRLLNKTKIRLGRLSCIQTYTMKNTKKIYTEKEKKSAFVKMMSFSWRLNLKTEKDGTSLMLTGSRLQRRARTHGTKCRKLVSSSSAAQLAWWHQRRSEVDVCLRYCR